MLAWLLVLSWLIVLGWLMGVVASVRGSGRVAMALLTVAA